MRYVNDSKATNADAAAKALVCYDPIYWIIGGRAKEGGLAGLDPFYPRVRHAYLIGECANDFARQLRGKLPFTQCGTLDKAVAAASAEARKERKPGATVLLSPACASWDQYPNFEARGDHFRAPRASALERKGGGMTNFTRADRSVVGLWWWTVDRWTLATVGALMFMGAILVLAASPAVATRIGLDSFHMVRQHYVMLPAAFALVIGVSMLSPKQVRRLGVLLFLLFLGLTTLTLFYGSEIKGATRWISVGPFSLQPSEFLKPTFAIFAAWMFSLKMSEQRVPGNLIAIAVFGLVVVRAAEAARPRHDRGHHRHLVRAVLRRRAALHLGRSCSRGLGIGGLVGAYFMFPHVQERVDQFLKGTGDSYQIDRALEAFQNGGLTGRGPGEGSVKMVLPDAHSDFIFAVAGEEFGLIVCLLLVVLLRLHRAARAVAHGARAQPVRAARRHRPCHRLRPAGGHQHGVQPAPDADQGHDPALHLLWRLVDHRDRARRRHAAGADPQALPGEPRHMSAPRILLAAGGTGGHMFPAEALAHALLKRGLAVDLVTDERGGGFGDRLPQVKVHRIASGGVAGKGLVARLRNFARLGLGFVQSRSLLRSLKPAVVVGFGGYPSIPPLTAAQRSNVPTLLHEQNAVMGRANRFLAKRAAHLALSFDQVKFADIVPAERRTVTGNPVRPEISAIADAPYAAPQAGGPVRLFVMGGSLGARVFGKVVPEAVALLPQELRHRLAIAQQARADDLTQAQDAYRALGITADLKPFFDDVPQRLRQAHLLITRAGASTVAELAAAGRPAMLVPLPNSIDDHQMANAHALESDRRRLAAAGKHDVAGRAGQDPGSRPRRPRAPGKGGGGGEAASASATPPTGWPTSSCACCRRMRAPHCREGRTDARPSSRHRRHPFRRHRRHRHERHRRDPAQSRLQGARQRHQRSRTSPSGCATSRSRSRSATGPRTWPTPRSSSSPPP